jgi:lysophospholipase L1-like esterase
MKRFHTLAPFAICLVFASLAEARAEAPTPAELLEGSKRVVFLGDSITAAGRYVAIVEAWLVATKGDAAPRVLDLGLPSETVSGLSEEGHAGGKFPRPDLAERLERVLNLTKPDLVIACYGINCGIYEPFDKERFERYQHGMSQLKTAVEKKGAKLIVVTPPSYDDQRAPKAFSYNEVLDRYSAWLVDQRKNGWCVIDLHGPMTAELRKRRTADSQFTFQPDGVHPNDEGHWFVAQQVIRGFGDERAAAATSPAALMESLHASAEFLPLVQKRVDVLRNAYVNGAGHKRPGLTAKLTVPEADKEAEVLTAQIRKQIAGTK